MEMLLISGEIIIDVIARQDHDKSRSLPLTGVHRHRPPALLHEHLGYSQADSQTGSAGRSRSVEQFEHLDAVVPRHSRSVVRYPQLVASGQNTKSYTHP